MVTRIQIPCVIKTLGDQCPGFDLKNTSCACFPEAEAAEYVFCLRKACPVADALSASLALSNLASPN